MKLFVGVVKAVAKAGKANPPKAVTAAQRPTKECPHCHYYFRGAVCPHCANDFSPVNNLDSRSVSGGCSAAKATDFLPPIPEGYQIYKRMLYVAGISFRKDDASPFIRSSCHSLEFEREPNNPKDKNAVKVIGVTPSSRYFVGYVPKEISEQLVKTGLLDKVQPRLDRTYHGIKDFVEIRFQIIGPKENKKQFDAFLKSKPASPEQKLFFRFFGLHIPKGLTREKATQTIKEYSAELMAHDASRLEEFGAYQDILEEFNDSEFRREYELKKPSAEILEEVLERLRRDGNSYADLYINIQDVVDMLVKFKPELARANY